MRMLDCTVRTSLEQRIHEVRAPCRYLRKRWRQRSSQCKGPETETGLVCQGRVVGDEVNGVHFKGFALMLGGRGGWSVWSTGVT